MLTTELSNTARPQIILENIFDATTAEAALVKKGVAYINQIASSSCFKDAIFVKRFTETGGKTNQDIWDTLVSRPYAVNVKIYTGTWIANHFYHTIGKTDASEKSATIKVNRQFVRTAYDFGNNLMHEVFGHIAGFRHDRIKATSVPYQLNDIYADCALKLGIPLPSR